MVVVILALFTPLAAFAQAPTAPQKLATIEGITEYRLDNGLRILLFSEPGSSTVTVNLTVLVGSRHEGYGETGMAHLLEHMVFKGTPTHPDIPKALKDRGASYNGTTWVDRTNYFETLPGTDENLEFALRLEADRLVNSFVKRDDLVSEMTVVRNEFEAGENSPDRILSQRMLAVAYEWHNYGKSTIGNRSDIERVPIDRLQAFYRKYYQPDNAVLVVAGKFDEKKALGYIGKHFGAIPRPKRVLETTYTEEPPQDGERFVTLRRVGKVGVVGVVYHVPAGAHEDFPAVQVLNSILVSEPSGRLYKALVETKKATSVSGAAYAWHDPGVLEINAQVDPKNSLEAVRDTIIDVVEKLHQEQVSDTEVKRAKARFKRDRDQLITRPSSVAITLSEWVSKGDWRLFFLHRDRVEKVTPADVQRVAQKYLTRSNRTVGLFIPTDKAERAPVPPGPEVAGLVDKYKSTRKIVPGEPFEPTPDNLEKRIERRGESAKAGPKTAVLPKKSPFEAVTLRLTLRFGNEKSLAGQNAAAQLLGPMLARGTTKHSRLDLQDEFDLLSTRLGVSSGVGVVQVSVDTRREYLAEVVPLVIEVLRSPTFPTNEFEILRREYVEQLQRNMTEPTALASRFLQRQLNPYPKDDVRYVPTYEEEIARFQAVTSEQVKALYTQQLGGQHCTLAVVGHRDAGAPPGKAGPVEALEAALRDWKAGVAYQRIERPASTATPGGKEIILTPDKANAMYLASHNLAITDSDPDYPALEIANFVLGGGTLSSRLGNRVRQKEGLSYGVGSMFSADAKDKAGRIMMFAICNPLNMEKVEKAIAEELDKLLGDGISEAELGEAKKAWLAGRQRQRADDAALAGQLEAGLFLDRTFAWHAELEKKVAALKLDDVNAALRRHFQPKKLVIAEAGDFKKK
jgi:zinc protease